MQDTRIEEKIFDAIYEKGDYDIFAETDYSRMWEISGLGRATGRKSVFEAGCGTGAFGRRLASMGYNVTGADISGMLVKKANQLSAKSGLMYKAVKIDLLNMKNHKKRYDYVLCPAVLHHFTELDPVISSLACVLKKRGALILIEPNGSHPVVKFSEFIRKNLWPFNTMKNIATPNETMHSVADYVTALEKAGFKIGTIAAFEPHMKKTDFGFFMNVLLFIKYEVLQKFFSMILSGYRSGSLLVIKVFLKKR
jgi:2-polyprenyl-3-methyl-5-hydroxy-6-metoxy-1,4-benzoquinol methylase